MVILASTFELFDIGNRVVTGGLSDFSYCLEVLGDKLFQKLTNGRSFNVEQVLDMLIFNFIIRLA